MNGNRGNYREIMGKQRPDEKLKLETLQKMKEKRDHRAWLQGKRRLAAAALAAALICSTSALAAQGVAYLGQLFHFPDGKEQNVEGMTAGQVLEQEGNDLKVTIPTVISDGKSVYLVMEVEARRKELDISGAWGFDEGGFVEAGNSSMSSLDAEGGKEAFVYTFDTNGEILVNGVTMEVSKLVRYTDGEKQLLSEDAFTFHIPLPASCEHRFYSAEGQIKLNDMKTPGRLAQLRLSRLSAEFYFTDYELEGPETDYSRELDAVTLYLSDGTTVSASEGGSGVSYGAAGGVYSYGTRRYGFPYPVDLDDIKAVEVGGLFVELDGLKQVPEDVFTKEHPLP